MDTSRVDVRFDAETLRSRIAELGAQIQADHPGGPLIVIGVLKGSFLFLADLVRAMADMHLEIEFLGVRSYEGMESTGAVQITHDLRRSLEGKHCLIVEDIVDTGLTLRYLKNALLLRRPETLKVATLLDKAERRLVPFEADYVGFPIPNHFVVGYGLDLDEAYRNLPYVGIYRP